MAGGRGRAGRRRRGGGAGRSGQGARGGPPPRPPPPCPPPPPPAPPDQAAAAANSVEDSPATRTRRQLMLALQAGSNSADCHDGGREGRGRAADVTEDSSTRRTRQRLAAASHVSAPGNAHMMRRLFADTDRSEEEDDDDDGEDDPAYDEPVAAPIHAPATDGRQVGHKGVMQYGNRLTNVGKDWLLEKCVKEDVFPKQKFANLNGDLDFSNNRNSICRFMAEKMKVQEADVEGWWESSKKAVHKKLKNHRNNVIKTIKTKFNGEMVATDFCDIMLAMHYFF
ncbi:hypothetical protein MHU86_8826 [Fragilaria crotonensis]|nr:hypothetical protein MHU86_8826 [Fragilaria crotonensis]